MCLINKNRNKEAGSALLEVMVSMIVLIVGVMAFVQLQHIGVKRQHDINLREGGIRVINQLAETMRSGRGNALAAGFYANPATLGVITDCLTATCNASQLMTYKINIALREMTGFPPFTTGYVPVNRVGICISYNAGTNPTVVQLDFLWRPPTNVNNLVVGDCPAFGNRPNTGADLSAISTLINI